MAAFEPRYKDLVSILLDSVSRHPSRPLFGVKKDGQWSWQTYADFGGQVDRCRSALAQLGVGKGDRVAVISNNRVEWAIAAYATYGLLAAFVPMYEAQQEKEWKYILDDCGAKAVFCATKAIAEKVGAMKPDLPALQHVVAFDAPQADAGSFAALLEQGGSSPHPAQVPDPSLIAGYIYTSGTTGQPKGVLLSHSNLAMNVSAALTVFPLTSDDRSLSFLPWAHSFGQTAELHTMIGAGAAMAICEGIPKIIDNLAEVHPTVLMSVPNIFNKIYDAVNKQMAGKPGVIQKLFRAGLAAQTKANAGEKLGMGEGLRLWLAKKLIFRKIVEKFGGRMRYAVSGGAALSRDVARFVDALGITVFEGYGLTETSPVATTNTPNARRIGSVGQAIPGVTIKIDLEASGEKDEGEIVIYGHNVMQGYYHLPEETQKVFTEDGGFRTGDLGRLDADGFLYITGRIKELYKLENGKYVAPVALESKLLLSPFIAQAMVYGANRKFNVAVIVPDFQTLKEWAATEGLDASDPAKLVRDEKVKAKLRAEIEAQSQGFKGFEGIRDFVLSSEEFAVTNDLLTPKLSMKRRNIVQRYQPEIDALYAVAEGAQAATG